MRVLLSLDAGAEDGPAHLVQQVASAARLGPGDDVILASVLPPPMISVASPSPVATAAAVTAVLASQEQQHRADEARAREALKAAAAALEAAGVPADRITTHVLPAAGGASGVGESIVEFVAAAPPDLVAVGSRGLGTFKRSLMSLVGLGSVSDYLAHSLAVPLLVVRPGEDAPKARDEPRTIVIAVDDSVHSAHALDFATAHVLREGDALHAVTVALPVPYPILDETSAAVAALEAQEWAHSSERQLAFARQLASRAAAAAAQSVRVTTVAEGLVPAGGASDVGAAIVKYAQGVKADLVIVGSRGMGSFRRSVMGFVGLGSVSDYAVHNLSCPVLVAKADEGALPAAARHADGAAAAAVAATPGPAAGKASAGGAARALAPAEADKDR